MRKFLFGLLAIISVAALADTFNRFAPATGVLKGNATTYVTTAASSADIAALWTGTCNSTTFLRGDGACAAASGGATLSSNTFTGNQTISKSNPQLDYYSTSGTTDEHWWRTEVSSAGDTWRLAIVSDDGLTILDVISAVRFHNSVLNIALAGPTDASDTFLFDADMGFATQVSPSALSAGNNNDYNPGGSIGSRTYFRLTPDATGSNITGIQSTSSRKLKYFWNIGTTGNIVLKNNSGSSSAGNKILTPNAADYTVQPGGGWLMIYDGTSSVWRVMDETSCLADGTGCTLPASSITSGTIATARLGSGSPSSTTALFGDQTYKTVGVPTSGTFTASGTGCSGVCGSYTLSRWSKTGNIGCVQLQNGGSGTSNLTTFTITNLPPQIAPNVTGGGVFGYVAGTDNGTTAMRSYSITNGATTITLNTNIDGSGSSSWTNTGTKGLPTGLNACWEVTP